MLKELANPEFLATKSCSCFSRYSMYRMQLVIAAWISKKKLSMGMVVGCVVLGPLLSTKNFKKELENYPYLGN